MAFSVRVQNFQSIKDATIEVDGLTVVTGPNNSGKTAFIRAIFGAFTNARGTKFVRHGEASAKVEIDFSDGRRLVWEKGEKVNRYELDGHVLNRVGHGAPSETTSLGVIPVDASGRELWPQFAHQFVGQVFLLDEPGSVLAEAVANVDKVGVLNESLRLSQSDRRSAAAELKVRLEDVTHQVGALQKFDGIDTVSENVQEVSRFHVRVENLRGEISDLSTMRDRCVRAKNVVESLHPVRGIPSVDEALVVRTKKIDTATSWAKSISLRLEHAESERDSAAKAYKSVQDHPSPDIGPVKEALSLLGRVSVLSTSLKAATEAVESLRARVSELDQEHAVSLEQVTSLLKEAGACPFCGASHEDDPC